MCTKAPPIENHPDSPALIHVYYAVRKIRHKLLLAPQRLNQSGHHVGVLVHDFYPNRPHHVHARSTCTMVRTYVLEYVVHVYIWVLGLSLIRTRVLEYSSTYTTAHRQRENELPCRNHKGHAPVRPGPY